MYEDRTRDNILKEMLDNSRSDVDKRQGAVTFDLSAPAAQKFEEAFMAFPAILKYVFVSEDQPREGLEDACNTFGVPIPPATKARGDVTINGVEGTIIPTGTQVFTNGVNQIYFTTVEETAITSGTTTVEAEAVNAGADGNVGIGEITLISGDITGITSVTNALPFEGGADEDPDDQLRQRYFDKVQRQATSGNPNHYVMWGKEVPGVYDAKCFPVWQGGGTVKLVLLSEEGRATSQTVTNNVIAYINNGRLPVGANLTVIGAPEVLINVSVTLSLLPGSTLEQAKVDIENGLRDYLKGLAFVDPMVRYSRIANVILDADGVQDYSNLTVNGQTGNITIPTDGSVAVNGVVTVS